MTFTFTLTTDIGKVRLLIPDRVETSAFFSDEEITAFLGLEGSNVKRTAALALETMASDQAMVLKVIRLLDLSTDGRAVSQALLERAARLREQAADEDDTDNAGFDIAEMVVNDFSYRERLYNEALREQ